MDRIAARNRASAVLIGLTLAVSPPAAAQTSTICQSAVAAWIGAQMELKDVERVYRACMSASQTACNAEKGRMRELQQQLKLIRNYIDRYCAR